ncbi:MAG: penicillin-binding protein 2 [Desulfobacula sp.]|nr:penicillin-binding protein 2 [Desulfobacula sp.]
MAAKKNKSIKQRIIIVQVLFFALIFILGARSFDIQIFKSKELTRKAQKDYSQAITIKGERGQIFDRQMNTLATSAGAISISASPVKIKQSGIVAEKLSPILGISKSKLQKKLSSNRMFTWVARSVSPAQADQIKKLHINGIYFEDDFKRFYPQRDLAAQVLGFTNAEDSGLEGLEFNYNSILEGGTVKFNVIKDGNGRVFDIDKTKRAQLRGKSIVLTLDKKIQYLSERVLETTVKKHRASSGMALVMQPITGELLSIAHYPRFNPNNFTKFNETVFRNRAITDAFEPGSTMKVFTAAAALEKGFPPKHIFYCENGSYKIGTYTIKDTHPHEWLSINQIIKFSSNIGAAKIVETIGDKALYDHLIAFGFGNKTRIGVPGETNGSLRPYRKWSRIDAGAISFGQGISVSALQLLSAISAIANGGILMKPMLVKKVISNTGETLRVYRPEAIRQVVSARTAMQVKQMMSLAVAEDGTGTKAAMDGYTVCGKTGTAQKALKNKKGYSKSKYISVFAGFAPKDDPKLAILVVVDEPQNQYYGGDVAAPAFKNIMAEAFNYLNIRPAKNESMIAMFNKEKTN